ncbi:MAG: hypothetical protein V3V47_00540, partial [Desulfobacteria bacterium]
IYDYHYAPHDILPREITSGDSRLTTAAKLGIKFRPVPIHRVEDRIDATKGLIDRCTFDEMVCADGIECLRGYSRKWNAKNNTYDKKPKHDWASHGADAFGIYAMGARMVTDDKPGGYRGPPTQDNTPGL